MISRKFVLSAAVFLFSTGISAGQVPQTSATASSAQSESLGEAARKARAEKKPSGRPAKVFLNDDMRRIKVTPKKVRSQSAPASGTNGTEKSGAESQN